MAESLVLLDHLGHRVVEGARHLFLELLVVHQALWIIVLLNAFGRVLVLALVVVVVVAVRNLVEIETLRLGRLLQLL